MVPVSLLSRAGAAGEGGGGGTTHFQELLQWPRREEVAGPGAALTVAWQWPETESRELRVSPWPSVLQLC